MSRERKVGTICSDNVLSIDNWNSRWLFLQIWKIHRHFFLCLKTTEAGRFFLSFPFNSLLSLTVMLRSMKDTKLISPLKSDHGLPAPWYIFMLCFSIKYFIFRILQVHIVCENRSVRKVVSKRLAYTTLKLIWYSNTGKQDYFFIHREMQTKVVEILHLSSHCIMAQMWKRQQKVRS